MRRLSVDNRASMLALAGLICVTGAARATVTPGSLFGDSYVVVDGDRVYSVLDVYVRCSTSKDIISGIFGVTAFPSTFTLNHGKVFQQSNGTSAASWLPVGEDGKAWDSFLTCGARVQGADGSLAGGEAGFLQLQLDANWSVTSGGSRIQGVGGGAGWYPQVGASTASNPYCRAGQDGGSASVPGWWNTAKCSTSIGGNGIEPGQSLSRHWMVGRFAIDVTGDQSADHTLTLSFGVAGRNYASESATSFTTFTGATQAAGRFSATLTFAQGFCPWPECPTDVDGSREVDLSDFALTLLSWGPCSGCSSVDQDGNDLVDMADAALVLLNFGPCDPCPCPGNRCQ